MQKLVERSEKRGTESDVATRNREFLQRHKDEAEMKIIF